jgi:hypothetical protein
MFLTGPLLALLATRGAAGGEPVEPSQKARLLAEAISELMNSIAFAVLLLGVPSVVAFVLYLRARRKGCAR